MPKQNEVQTTRQYCVAHVSDTNAIEQMEMFKDSHMMGSMGLRRSASKEHAVVEREMQKEEAKKSFFEKKA